MYKIVSSRGGGRTTTLCEYAINNEVNIVTPSSGKYILGMVHNKVKEKGYNIVEESKTQYGFHVVWDIGDNDYKEIDIIVAMNGSDNFKGTWHNKCVVDDADFVLNLLMRKYYNQEMIGLAMSME